MLMIFAEGVTSILEKPSDNLIFLVLIGGLVLGSLACIAGLIWHEFRKSEIEGALKHEMIARGMSADEIERVLAAKMNRGSKKVPAADQQTAPYLEKRLG